MSSIEDFTEEELRRELRRRSDIKRSAAKAADKFRVKWKYWIGIVQSVSSSDKGKAVYKMRFKVRPDDEVLAESFNYKEAELKAQPKLFTMQTLPNVGDRVKLRYYIHKREPNYIDESRIMEVIERRGQGGE